MQGRLFDTGKPGAPRKPRPRDTVFETAVKLFYPEGIPRGTRKMVNRFIEDLHALKATPEEMIARHQQMSQWPGTIPTLQYLTNKWNELESPEARQVRLAANRRERRQARCRQRGSHHVRWVTEWAWRCVDCGMVGERSMDGASDDEAMRDV